MFALGDGHAGWFVGIPENVKGYDTTILRRKSMDINPISQTIHVAGSGT